MAIAAATLRCHLGSGPVRRREPAAGTGKRRRDGASDRAETVERAAGTVGGAGMTVRS
jgi:hypothetical protein